MNAYQLQQRWAQEPWYSAGAQLCKILPREGDPTNILTALPVVDGAKPRDDLRGFDFRGLDLSRVILPGVHLGFAFLNGCCLIKADLAMAIAEGTQFQGANIEGANLMLFRANEACFDGTNLSRVHAMDSRFEACSMANCDFRGANLAGSRFERCDLRGADFRGVNLREVHLIDCALSMKITP